MDMYCASSICDQYFDVSFRISYMHMRRTPIPLRMSGWPHQLAGQRYCGHGKREIWQPIRATSRDRLSSETLEMEARVNMSCAARV